MPALDIRQLSKGYKAGIRGCSARVDAVRDVDLQLWPSELLGVVGAPGAGKSTLLLCASGALRPDSGTVHWFGQPAGRRTPEGGIAYVPDAPASYPFFSVRDALEHDPRAQALAPDERGSRIGEVVGAAGISRWIDSRIAAVPAGVARRVAVAQGLLGAPRIIILDEPFAGLDTVAQAAMAAMLRSLPLDGTTVLLASRVAQAVARTCTRVLVMGQGRLHGELDPARFQQAGRVAEMPR